MRINGEYGEYLAEDHSFASGGMGHLHRAQGDLVFKRYKKPITDRSESTTILRLREQGRRTYLIDGLAPGAVASSSVNWPIDTVPHPSGGIAGVVIPYVPAPFVRDDGGLQTLDFLLLKRAGPPDPKTRIIVLYRLCEILGRLDELGYVHGDLSSKNIVWRGGAEPSAYLIDADGIKPQKPAPSSGGVATPMWTDPRVVEHRIVAHDHLSDRYALALAIYRGLFLTPGNLDKREGMWPRPSAIPADAHPVLRRTLETSLGDTTLGKHRATPRQWQDVLGRAFFTNGAFDERAVAALPNPTTSAAMAARRSTRF